MRDIITDALGLRDLSPHEFPRIRRQILSDALLWNTVVMELLEERAPRILGGLNPLQKKRLREKLGFPDTPEEAVSWSFGNLNEKTPSNYVYARCPVCKQTVQIGRPLPRMEYRDFGGRRDEIFRPPNRDDVEKVLARLHFAHCGKVDVAPENIVAIARRDWMREMP